ncbi:hypothetical protein ASG50_25470 [Rhizobium sp. Leaf386]|nr:hypothetical protein ASG50_25470 [Rhizobium sp. Leaf386]
MRHATYADEAPIFRDYSRNFPRFFRESSATESAEKPAFSTSGDRQKYFWAARILGRSRGVFRPEIDSQGDKPAR